MVDLIHTPLFHVADILTRTLSEVFFEFWRINIIDIYSLAWRGVRWKSVSTI